VHTLVNGQADVLGDLRQAKGFAAGLESAKSTTPPKEPG
jgi:hypothetical protein